jgi:hypothetical protein
MAPTGWCNVYTRLFGSLDQGARRQTKLQHYWRRQLHSNQSRCYRPHYLSACCLHGQEGARFCLHIPSENGAWDPPTKIYAPLL